MTTTTTRTDPIIASSTDDDLTAAGGTLWEKYGKRRHYFDAVELAGVYLDCYKSGNIRGASDLRDPSNRISNTRAGQLRGFIVYVERGTLTVLGYDRDDWTSRIVEGLTTALVAAQAARSAADTTPAAAPAPAPAAPAPVAPASTAPAGGKP